MILVFYTKSFFSIDSDWFAEFIFACFFVVFFSIAFLFFEASELKSKKEFTIRKFNLILAITLTIVLFVVTHYAVRD